MERLQALSLEGSEELDAYQQRYAPARKCSLRLADEQPKGDWDHLTTTDLRQVLPHRFSSSVSSRDDTWRYLLILDGEPRVASTCKTAIFSGVLSREQAYS